MIVCKKCNGPNVIIAFWVNPNTREVDHWEPVFDYNEAPDNVQAQYCQDCQDEVEVEDATVVDIHTRRSPDQNWETVASAVLLTNSNVLKTIRKHFERGHDIKVVQHENDEQKSYDPIGGGGGHGRSDLPYGMGGGGD